jgi:hypothetical protein
VPGRDRDGRSARVRGLRRRSAPRCLPVAGDRVRRVGAVLLREVSPAALGTRT